MRDIRWAELLTDKMSETAVNPILTASTGIVHNTGKELHEPSEDKNTLGCSKGDVTDTLEKRGLVHILP